MGEILSINISVKKGTPKQEVNEALFIEDFGIENDAHAGKGHRQISLLASESIDKIREKVENGICFGRFAENITTKGLILSVLPIGTKIMLGEKVVLELTQIGKECHNDCEIKRLVGDCVMPREGIFAKVLVGGLVSIGDKVEVCVGDYAENV